MAVSGAAFGIERLPQVRHHRGEVLLILRTVDVVVAAQTWVLPVDVDAVDLVPAHERDHAVGETAAALGGECRVREVIGPGPAADGDQDPQMGMLPPEIREQLEILRVTGEPFDNAAVLDVGEGVVDVRQLVGGDLGRHDQLVARKHVGNDDRLHRRLCQRLPVRRQNGEESATTVVATPNVERRNTCDPPSGATTVRSIITWQPGASQAVGTHHSLAASPARSVPEARFAALARALPRGG